MINCSADTYSIGLIDLAMDDRQSDYFGLANIIYMGRLMFIQDA